MTLKNSVCRYFCARFISRMSMDTTPLIPPREPWTLGQPDCGGNERRLFAQYPPTPSPPVVISGLCTVCEHGGYTSSWTRWHLNAGIRVSPTVSAYLHCTSILWKKKLASWKTNPTKEDSRYQTYYEILKEKTRCHSCSHIFLSARSSDSS